MRSNIPQLRHGLLNYRQEMYVLVILVSLCTGHLWIAGITLFVLWLDGPPKLG